MLESKVDTTTVVKFKTRRKNQVILGVVLFILIAAGSVSAFILSQKRQDVRQQAYVANDGGGSNSQTCTQMGGDAKCVGGSSCPSGKTGFTGKCGTGQICCKTPDAAQSATQTCVECCVNNQTKKACSDSTARARDLCGGPVGACNFAATQTQVCTPNLVECQKQADGAYKQRQCTANGSGWTFTNNDASCNNTQTQSSTQQNNPIGSTTANPKSILAGDRCDVNFCRCPNNSTVDTTDKNKVIPKGQKCNVNANTLTACPASYAAGNGEGKCNIASQSLKTVTLANGSLCYTCEEKPSINCYVLTENCNARTFYAPNNTCPGGESHRFEKLSDCQTTQQASTKKTCYKLLEVESKWKCESKQKNQAEDCNQTANNLFPDLGSCVVILNRDHPALSGVSGEERRVSADGRFCSSQNVGIYRCEGSNKFVCDYTQEQRSTQNIENLAPSWLERGPCSCPEQLGSVYQSNRDACASYGRWSDGLCQCMPNMASPTPSPMITSSEVAGLAICSVDYPMLNEDETASGLERCNFNGSVMYQCPPSYRSWYASLHKCGRMGANNIVEYAETINNYRQPAPYRTPNDLTATLAIPDNSTSYTVDTHTADGTPYCSTITANYDVSVYDNRIPYKGCVTCAKLYGGSGYYCPPGFDDISSGENCECNLNEEIGNQMYDFPTVADYAADAQVIQDGGELESNDESLFPATPPEAVWEENFMTDAVGVVGTVVTFAYYNVPGSPGFYMTLGQSAYTLGAHAWTGNLDASDALFVGTTALDMASGGILPNNLANNVVANFAVDNASTILETGVAAGQAGYALVQTGELEGEGAIMANLAVEAVSPGDSSVNNLNSQ